MKGPRIEAPPPLNIPTSNTDTSTTSAAPVSGAVGGGSYSKPRSGSFSIAAHSPRQKLMPQAMTHAPTASEIPITLTTQSGDGEETTTVLSDMKNVDDAKGGEVAFTASGVMDASGGEGEGVTRAMRSNSAAAPVKPRAEAAGEQANVSIPINAPVIKNVEPYFGDKKSLTIRIASELLPNKEFSFQSDSNIAGDILNNVINIYYHFLLLFTLFYFLIGD